MYAECHAVSLVTTAGGDATGYTPVVTGRVLEIRVVVPGSGGVTSGADFTITNELTGAAILTLTNQNGSGTFNPQAPVCGLTGVGLTYDATRTINAPVVVVGGRVKVVLAQGGNVLACTVYVTVG